jgi:hypothetical protein
VAWARPQPKTARLTGAEFRRFFDDLLLHFVFDKAMDKEVGKSLWRGVGVGVITGLIYGLALRLLGDNAEAQTFLTVMSLGFMVAGPLAIGWVTVAAMPPEHVSRLAAFFWPFIPVLLGCIVTVLLRIEGFICVAMYLPLGLILSGVGGILATAKFRRSKSTMAFVMLMPFVIHGTEGTIKFETEEHRVHNTIEIDAGPASIWNQIKSVPTITSDELQDSWVHKIGFPRPLDAVIDHEGVGGIRLARFERGLVFNETVDSWLPNESLSFAIAVDPKDIPPSALDEHVTIGGPFFDVLHGEYRIEHHPDGRATLHLESRFRLSTHFNAYAGMWTDLIMHQIQSDILSVIKKRSEQSISI